MNTFEAFRQPELGLYLDTAARKAILSSGCYDMIVDFEAQMLDFSLDGTGRKHCGQMASQLTHIMPGLKVLRLGMLGDLDHIRGKRCLKEKDIVCISHGSLISSVYG